MLWNYLPRDSDSIVANFFDKSALKNYSSFHADPVLAVFGHSDEGISMHPHIFPKVIETSSINSHHPVLCSTMGTSHESRESRSITPPKFNIAPEK